jgi:hypothetical protein
VNAMDGTADISINNFGHHVVVLRVRSVCEYSATNVLRRTSNSPFARSAGRDCLKST